MAKKGRTGYLGMFAFIAMILNAIAWILQIAKLDGKISSILLAVGSLMLTIVCIFVAHDFAERQSQVWKIIFWILAILSLLAILFGVGHNFF